MLVCMKESFLFVCLLDKLQIKTTGPLHMAKQPVQCTISEGTIDPGLYSMLHAQPNLASRCIIHCKLLKESGNLSPSTDFSTKLPRDPWQVPFLLCTSISSSVTWPNVGWRSPPAIRFYDSTEADFNFWRAVIQKRKWAHPPDSRGKSQHEWDRNIRGK